MYFFTYLLTGVSLLAAEDNLNISMKDVTVTQRDGRVTQLEQVYVRGPMVRFYILPDMLVNAPMFKRSGAGNMKGRGIGTARGRATIARATCESLQTAVSNKRGPLAEMFCWQPDEVVGHEAPQEVLLADGDLFSKETPLGAGAGHGKWFIAAVKELKHPVLMELPGAQQERIVSVVLRNTKMMLVAQVKRQTLNRM